MKNRPSLLPWLAILAASASPLHAARDKGVDVLVAADAVGSPEVLRPTAGKPIHYIFTQSRQTLGDVVTGVKLPDAATVEKAVVAELTKQGYVRTEVGGPMPDIIVLAVIGDSNFKSEIPVGNPLDIQELRIYLEAVNIRDVLHRANLWVRLDGPSPPSLESLFATYPSDDFIIADMQDAVLAEACRLRNLDPKRKRQAIKALIGAGKIDRAVAARNLSRKEAEQIAWAAYDDKYFIAVSALEAKKRPDGSRALLWRTTMLIDMRRDFTRELPAMLAQGGPFFGIDVLVPGFVNTAKPREGKVELGEATAVKPNDAAKESPVPTAK